MEIRAVLDRIDHTLLKQECTWEQIKVLCDEGIRFQTASVCIPPAFVRRAADYVRKAVKICTVIGFPNGYSTTAAKVFETEEAVENGADEIDMVINVGMVKEGRWDIVLAEIRAVREVCRGKILKVIVEACLLNVEEKVRICGVVSQSGAEYIKTSTGFSSGGATQEDVILFRKYLVPDVKIKAAGGIRTLKEAEEFIHLGADRVGASAVVAAVMELPAWQESIP